MAFLRPAYYADSEMDFRVFAASLRWGFGGGFRMFQASLLWVNTAVAEITIGGWAKVIMCGGYFLLIARGDLKPNSRRAQASLVWGMRGQN